MRQFGHNGLISMDATFGTNDVKYHLFTLMMFDFHRIRVLVAWVITGHQLINVEANHNSGTTLYAPN
jgi:hypothetical protein